MLESTTCVLSATCVLNAIYVALWLTYYVSTLHFKYGYYKTLQVFAGQRGKGTAQEGTRKGLLCSGNYRTKEVEVIMARVRALQS